MNKMRQDEDFVREAFDAVATMVSPDPGELARAGVERGHRRVRRNRVTAVAAGAAAAVVLAGGGWLAADTITNRSAPAPANPGIVDSGLNPRIQARLVASAVADAGPDGKPLQRAIGIYGSGRLPTMVDVSYARSARDSVSVFFTLNTDVPPRACAGAYWCRRRSLPGGHVLLYGVSRGKERPREPWALLNPEGDAIQARGRGTCRPVCWRTPSTRRRCWRGRPLPVSVQPDSCPASRWGA